MVDPLRLGRLGVAPADAVRLYRALYKYARVSVVPNMTSALGSGFVYSVYCGLDDLHLDPVAVLLHKEPPVRGLTWEGP